VYNWRGGRFAACGLRANSQGVRLDLYGDVGDYAGSGLDGAEVHIHGAAQDQVGQILKDGKLVIRMDVGQVSYLTNFVFLSIENPKGDCRL